MGRYFGQNIRSFSAVCHNNFGRKVITTKKDVINASNIVEELNKADYSSEEEKQAVRRYVEGAWKKTGLGKEEKVPRGLFLLA